MPYTIPSDLHDDAFLTNVSVLRMNQPNAYIAGRLFPRVQVEKETDKFITYNLGDWARNKAGYIPDGGVAPAADYGSSSTTYQTQEYGLRSKITDRMAQNADQVFRLAVTKARYVADQTMFEREIQCAAVAFSTSVFTNTSAVTLPWSDPNSTPINDMLTAINYVEDYTMGYAANKIVVGVEHWRELQVHPQVIAALYGPGGAGPTVVTPQLLANFLMVDEILIGRGKKTTTGESGTDISGSSLTNLWGTYCGAFYVSPTPAEGVPSAGYRFEAGYTTRTYYDEPRKTTWIEARENAVHKQVANDAGYLLSSI